MKCPNCSFMNTDEIKTCRVCGFDLTPIETPTSEEINGTLKSVDSIVTVETPSMTDTKISKRRMIDDSEDEALDSAFKSIFGIKGDNEDDPLDVATVERLLQKKRHVQSLASEELKEVLDEEDFDEEMPFKENEETIVPISRKKIVFMMVLSGLLLLLLALKVFIPELPWKYESTIVITETTEVESTEIESTTETALNLGDDLSLVPVNAFFNMLPDFINRGNLTILGLFENSQEALEVLTSFAVIGNLEKITEATLTESDITEDSAMFTVTTLTNRLIDGQQTQTDSVWDFRSILKNDIWVLESLAFETGETVTQNTTEKTTETTTEKVTETSTAETTEATTKETTTEEITTAETTTEAPLLSGFSSSGNFSGGKFESGQDIAFARYGYHDTYERLAFDLYAWIGGKPDQPADSVTSYTANLSDDGRTISIILTGAIEAYASQSTLNLTNSANIDSVSYNYFGNGDAVAITISLKQRSQFKVFNLESPAKLVVDIATFE